MKDQLKAIAFIQARPKSETAVSIVASAKRQGLIFSKNFVYTTRAKAATEARAAFVKAAAGPKIGDSTPIDNLDSFPGIPHLPAIAGATTKLAANSLYGKTRDSYQLEHIILATARALGLKRTIQILVEKLVNP